MPWTDPEFPANYSSLQQSGCDNETVTWKRASEICPNACLRGKFISAPVQGQLGNCWLVVAFHALAKCDETWKRVFGSGDDCFDSGKVVVNLWVLGQWQPIMIDDLLPVYKTRGCWELLNACNVEKSQFWAALLEKACAKKFGCYKNLISGQPSEGFLLITGGYTWMEKFPRELPCQEYDALRCKVMHFLKSNTVDSVFLDCQITRNDVEMGDFEFHCYSFVLCENTLQLWNPLPGETNPICNVISTMHQCTAVPTANFATTSLSRIFETTACEWTEKLVDGEWKLSSSGGSVVSSTYCNNPQYSLSVESASDVLVLHVTLIQPSKRNCAERKELLQAIGVHVYRAPIKPTMKLTERQLKGLECIACLHPTYQYSQNVSLCVCRICSDKNRSYFVIVPSTFMKNACSKYMLRIVCNSRLEFVLL